jgi:hypothetical protein
MKKIAILLLFLTTFQLVAQNPRIDSLQKELKKSTLTKSEQATLNLKIASAFNGIRNKNGLTFAENALQLSEEIDSTKIYFRALLEVTESKRLHGETNTILKDFERVKTFAKSSDNRKLLLRTNSSLISYYISNRKPDEALPLALESIDLAETDEEKFQTLIGMAYLQGNLRNFQKSNVFALEAYIPLIALNNPKKETNLLSLIGSNYMRLKEPELAKQYLNDAIEVGTKTQNLRETVRAYNDLGVMAINIDNDTLRATQNFEKALQISNEVGDQRLGQYSSMMLGRIYIDSGKSSKGFSILKKAYQETIAMNNLNYASQLANTIALQYETRLKNSDSALKWNKQASLLKDSITDLQKLKNFTEIETKYEVTEKDKENAGLVSALIAKRKEQLQLLVIGIGVLAILLLIGFLIYKNLKRKQKLLEQKRVIDLQEIDRILREQELTTIDAIIAGQEKERKHIAADLHDNIGANLAAIKLQFKHISDNKGRLDELENLFSKTEILLDETAKEVRDLAHRKNSGVFATQGLLPAVQKLTSNTTVTNNLKVELTQFGLNERLDNTFELTIFRILQELITNVIKHANASEANISITRHDDFISIIVEDNGNGFDFEKMRTDKKMDDGMGLSSVEKRVQHLNGSFEIESHPDSGTQVLIDIPFKKAG